MSCECYQIGGRFIAEDPDCPAHGAIAQEEEREREAETNRLEDRIASLEREVAAWRDTFKPFKYSIDKNDIVSIR